MIDAVSEVQDKVAERTEKSKLSQPLEEPSVGDMVEEINKSPIIRNTSLQFVFDEKANRRLSRLWTPKAVRKLGKFLLSLRLS